MSWVMIAQNTYTAAATDAVLLSVASSERVVAESVFVAADGANAGNVSVSITFGGGKPIAKHPGLKPGSGFTWSPHVDGAQGDDLLVTTSGGTVTVSVAFSYR